MVQPSPEPLAACLSSFLPPGTPGDLAGWEMERCMPQAATDQLESVLEQKWVQGARQDLREQGAGGSAEWAGILTLPGL